MELDNHQHRQIMIKQRQLLTLEEVKRLSSLIFHHLNSISSYRLAKHIALYVDIRHEVQTHQILADCFQNNKHVYVPRVLTDGMEFYEIASFDDLCKGNFGILEPAFHCPKLQTHLDLMIVPLVMFDSKGNRLGMGGGYYDRYLAMHQCHTIGLAYAFQHGQFNVFDHDIALNQIITEEKIWTFRQP